MKKNILAFLVILLLGAVVATGCSKDAVVKPKQSSNSAVTAKTGTGTTTTTTTSTGTSQGGEHHCGGGGYSGTGSTSH